MTSHPTPSSPQAAPTDRPSFRTPGARSRRLPTTLRWLATFAGFPIGGYAGWVLAGPIDHLAAAAGAGVITGLGVGVAQAWGLRLNRAATLRWVLATAIGVGFGLAAGAMAVDYRSTLGALAVQGAITGLAAGLAQSVLLRRLGGTARLTFVFPVAVSALWALGWIVTTSAGIAVQEQFPIFGSSGAIVVAVLTLFLPRSVNTDAPGIAA